MPVFAAHHYIKKCCSKCWRPKSQYISQYTSQSTCCTWILCDSCWFIRSLCFVGGVDYPERMMHLYFVCQLLAFRSILSLLSDFWEERWKIHVMLAQMESCLRAYSGPCWQSNWTLPFSSYGGVEQLPIARSRVDPEESLSTYPPVEPN